MVAEWAARAKLKTRRRFGLYRRKEFSVIQPSGIRVFQGIVDRIELLHFLMCDLRRNIPCVWVKKTSLRKVCTAYFILRTAEFRDT